MKIDLKSILSNNSIYIFFNKNNINILLFLFIIINLIIGYYIALQNKISIIKEQENKISIIKIQEPIEKRNIAIDEYNFKQLQKVKQLINKKKLKFKNLDDFNNKYNVNIKPIKNCYYISSDNGNEKFIFGFALESKKYREKYGKYNYIYPKYDIPEDILCTGYCNDINLELFNKTIFNTCIGSISGYVYEDINKNGTKDKLEKGIEGINIIGGVHNIERVYTNNEGYYKIKLKKGKKEIELDTSFLKNRKIITPENNKHIIKLESGEHIENINFGIK